MSSKRAIAQEMVLAVMRVFLLIIAIVALWFIINMFLVSRIETFDIESFVLVNRLLYSPKGIAYYDKDLDRVYPGIIDLEKFNEGTINDIAYLPDNQIISAKLVLYDMSGKELKTVYLNKQGYERWEPITGFEGKGATTKITKSHYVLYLEKGIRKPGMLKAEVIIPHA